MIFRPLTSIKLNNNNRIKDLQKKTMSIPHSGPQGKRSLTKTTRKKGLNGHQIYPLGGQELFFFFFLNYKFFFFFLLFYLKKK